MLRLLLALASIVLVINSCSVPRIKIRPEHRGVAPELRPFVREFKQLAWDRGIGFYDRVSIGFKSINQGNAIGMCTYGGFWREIDIDIDFWNRATPTSKLALMFHELAHCYCTRGHDFADGTEYPEPKFMDFFSKCTTEPGYYPDGCPLSIMHPIIIEDTCVANHYNDYVNELFNRCDPW